MSWVSSERICLAVSDTLCIKHNGKSQLGASVDLLKESAQSDRKYFCLKTLQRNEYGREKTQGQTFPVLVKLPTRCLQKTFLPMSGRL